MKTKHLIGRVVTMRVSLFLLAAVAVVAQPAGNLPNGWKITPAGKHVVTADYVLNLTTAPSDNQIVALHSGYNPHGLLVIDPKNVEITQRTPLKSAWFGMAWAPDGKTLYISGGNAESRQNPTVAPVYGFGYAGGKLSDQPTKQFKHHLPQNQIYWSGLAHHPKLPILYAANRHTKAVRGHVVAFDTNTGERLAEMPTEIHPYDVVIDSTGSTLYVSNWASDSITVFDTATQKVKATIKVGHNPNDMVLARDGRLYVACSNENSVYVVDTKQLRPIEVISTASWFDAQRAGTRSGAEAVVRSQWRQQQRGGHQHQRRRGFPCRGLHSHRVVPGGSGGFAGRKVALCRRGEGHGRIPEHRWPHQSAGRARRRIASHWRIAKRFSQCDSAREPKDPNQGLHARGDGELPL